LLALFVTALISSFNFYPLFNFPTLFAFVDCIGCYFYCYFGYYFGFYYSYYCLGYYFYCSFRFLLIFGGYLAEAGFYFCGGGWLTAALFAGAAVLGRYC